MDDADERRLSVENLRTRLELLETQRRALLRELATHALPAQRRAETLVHRAELQRSRDQTIRALRDLGEPVDDH